MSLIAPTSHERVRSIAREAQGFVYCVSSLGVTGVRSKITTDIAGMVELVREASNIPVAVGFGISTPEQAARMAAVSDGAIVGSAIVRIVAEHGEGCVPYVESTCARWRRRSTACIMVCVAAGMGVMPDSAAATAYRFITVAYLGHELLGYKLGGSWSESSHGGSNQTTIALSDRSGISAGHPRDGRAGVGAAGERDVLRGFGSGLLAVGGRPPHRRRGNLPGELCLHRDGAGRGARVDALPPRVQPTVIALVLGIPVLRHRALCARRATG